MYDRVLDCSRAGINDLFGREYHIETGTPLNVVGHGFDRHIEDIRGSVICCGSSDNDIYTLVWMTRTLVSCLIFINHWSNSQK